MEKEELNRIIALIESKNSKDEAYLELCYGYEPDECYAKANQEGLELYAAYLLKTALKCEEALIREESKFIELDYEKWIEGELFIQHVELVDKNTIDIRAESDENTFLGKVFGLGCIGILIFGFISVIVGAVSIFKWLF